MGPSTRKPLGKEFDYSWVLIAIYIFMLIVAFPRGTVAVSDDFGYLDTASKSIAAGYPITSEWLGPNSLMIGVMSIIAYAATKSFYLSTYGVLFIFSVSNIFVVSKLFQTATNRNGGECRTASIALLSVPIFFNKLVDYTGFSPYVFFYCLAIIFFLRKNIWGLSASIAAAFFLRESAIALLVFFPFIAKENLSVRPFKLARSVAIAYPAALLIISLAIAKRLLNTTYAQRNVTQKLLERFDFYQSFSVFALVLTVSILSYTIALLSFSRVEVKPLTRKSFVAIVLLTLIWYFGFFGRYPNNILWEAPYLGLGPWTSWILAGASLVGLVIFSLTSLQLQSTCMPILCLCLVDSMLIASASWGLWGYYLFGPILCGTILALMAPTSAIRISLPRTFAMALYIMLFGLYSVRLGIAKEYSRHRIIAYELLYRDGYSPTGFSGMPFGYAGWKLFDHYINNEGLVFDKGLAGFLCYRDSKSIRVEASNSMNTNQRIDGEAIATYRISKWWAPWKKNTYNMIALPQDRKVPTEQYCRKYFFKSLDKASSPVFPLDDSEWKSYIDSSRGNR